MVAPTFNDDYTHLSDVFRELGGEFVRELKTSIRHCAKLAAQDSQSNSVSSARNELEAASNQAKNMVRTIESLFTGQHVDLCVELLAFADKCLEKREAINVDGGRGSLFIRQYGPPDWHLALQIGQLWFEHDAERKLSLFKDELPRDTFAQIYIFSHSRAFGDYPRTRDGQISEYPEIAKEALALCRKKAPIEARMRQRARDIIRQQIDKEDCQELRRAQESDAEALRNAYGTSDKPRRKYVVT